MSTFKTIGIALIIIGVILAGFGTLDPRVKTPIFMDNQIKYVAYRQAIMTTDNTTKTYEQVVLLVTGRAELPDTKVTINYTAYPITSGRIYYFSGFYFYMPTFYTNAEYMSIGALTYTNVYTKYHAKYVKIQQTLTEVGGGMIILGIILLFMPEVKIQRREEKEEKEEVRVSEEVVEEEEYEDFYHPEEEYEEYTGEDEDIIFTAPLDHD